MTITTGSTTRLAMKVLKRRRKEAKMTRASILSILSIFEFEGAQGDQCKSKIIDIFHEGAQGAQKTPRGRLRPSRPHLSDAWARRSVAKSLRTRLSTSIHTQNGNTEPNRRRGDHDGERL